MTHTPTAVDWDRLERVARETADHSWSPYSMFRVGAAIQTSGGDVVGGCNVENISIGLSHCAERTAVVRAIAAGQLHPADPTSRVVAVLVYTPTPTPTPPCGMCRQVLGEFADPDCPIRSVGLEGAEINTTLGTLFPSPFSRDPNRQP